MKRDERFCGTTPGLGTIDAKVADLVRPKLDMWEEDEGIAKRTNRDRDEFEAN